MATYTNVISWFKPLSRSESFPIDASSVQESLSAAQSYKSNPIAYAGQVLSVLNTDTNKYELYVLQPGDDGYTLEKPGVDAANLKQYVMVVDSLPASNQVEGVLYINKADSTGSIWTAGAWKQVFADVSEDVADFESRIGTLETDIDLKAPINNPVFTGTVTLAADPADNLQAATKQYVDRLVAGIVDCTPGIADLTDNTLPTTGYKAGQTWRVAEDGTYAGQECEIGDLIICIKDYAEGGSAGNADFMIIQANIDGAVTSSADATTDGDIVVYDGITGKVIKSSSVNISSLNDAIAKAHEHSNKTQLDSFTMDQTALLAAAKQEAQTLVDVVAGEVDTLEQTVAGKADASNVYTKSEIDDKVNPLTTLINGKVDAATVDSKISEALGDFADTSVKDYVDQALADKVDQSTVEGLIDGKIGDIGTGTTVKQYIDNAIGSGGTDTAEAIAQAKEEAIETAQAYTDSKVGNLGEDPDVVTYVTNQINLACNVVEF